MKHSASEPPHTPIPGPEPSDVWLRRLFTRRLLPTLLVAAVLFLLLERWVRYTYTSHFETYVTIPTLMKNEKPDALFIGSSRVLAAVDTDEFDCVVGRRLGRAFHSRNLASGFSTLATHYLGLRDWVASDPDVLRDCTVFVEAPAGLPDWVSWKKGWVGPDTEFLIVPLLRGGDLDRLWRSGLSGELKTDLTLRYLGRPSDLLTYRTSIRECILTDWIGNCEGILQSLNPHDHGARSGGYFPSDPGRRQRLIEADRATSRFARAWVRAAIESQQPVCDWSHTIVANIVTLVQRNGGNVVFFSPPLNALQMKMYETPTRREDRQMFLAQAAAWNTPVLVCDFPTRESDFPDSLHLIPSRVPEFTRRLASAWLELQKAGAYHPPSASLRQD